MWQPPRRNILGCALALGAALATGVAPAAEPPPDDPMAKVFVLTPEDFNAFWKKLQDPDFVWMTGAEFQRRLKAAAAAPLPASSSGVVALATRGEVFDELAHLAIDLEIAAPGPEPSWASIRLDGLAVTRAREKDRELPIRQAEKGGWQVEVRGAGRHVVRVELLAPVKAGAEGHTLTLEIPEAATTHVDLQVGSGVISASAGTRDPLAIEPVEGGQRTRLSAHLTSRPRLELTWRVAAEPGAQLPPLLAAKGEIALEVDRGAVLASSSWTIKSERGAARSLELTLDPAEELLGVMLDGRAMPPEGKLDPATATLTVPLADPLRPGASCRLSLSTRRPLPAGPWSFAGNPLAHASSQSGLLAVSQEEGLWVSGVEGRGLVRIDPRADLPEGMKRPSTMLAYRFLDQPFALGLRAEAAPPRLRASTRTVVTVEATSAIVDTWIDYRATRGRIFEMRIGLPGDLELKSVGPEEAVESSQVQEGGGQGSEGRSLVVVLSARARDGGSFRLHLLGRRAIAEPGEVGVGLFRPSDCDGGKIALVVARNVSADPSPDASGFAPAAPPTLADWQGPPERPWDATWLRQDGTPPTLPLRLAVHPRSVQVETTLTAELDRAGLDLRQESTCHVHHGTLSAVDVSVPRALEGRWELEGADVSSRSRLGPGPDGATLYRLALRREATEALKLRFRSRLPMEALAESDGPRRVQLPKLRFPDAEELPARAAVIAGPGVVLKPEGAGWTAEAGDDSASRWNWVGPGSGTGLAVPTVVATAPALASLPPLVASRLWLRSLQMPEGEAWDSAWYRVDVHPGTMAVALPEGAVWVRATVNGEAVSRVERLPKSAGFRFRFPAGTAAGPALVVLEYRLPSRRPSAAFTPPALLEGGLVQQTLWEVRVPWNLAAVGVPAGWTDENRWNWDQYVWKRHPRKAPEALAGWAAGPLARPPLPEDAGEGDRGDFHGYLFGRPGDPIPLRPWIASRAGLVGACSGATLALGLLWLIFLRRGRLVAASSLALALAVSAATLPAATFLAVQSAAVGVALTLLAALTRHLVDRREAASPSFPPASGLTPALGAGRGVLLPVIDEPPGVGSDRSTVVRSRIPSTIDRAASTPPEGPG